MVFCDPVLIFVKAFRLKGDANALKHAALSRFSTSMLLNAKKLLWEHCDEDLHSLALPLTSRRGSEKRSQAAADLEDILLAFTKLDEVDKIPLIFCEASELVQQPPISVDPIGEMISGNAASLKLLDDKISQIQDDLNGLSSKFDSGYSSVTPPAVSYSDAVRSPPNPVSVPPIEGSILSNRIRSHNLIVFGLPEVKSLPELKELVDQLLTFVAGRPVPLNDLFRLGRLNKPTSQGACSEAPTRPRPVLLKVSSAWDRRLILSTVRKLRDYTLKRIYIREGLSSDERLKRREAYLARTRKDPTPLAVLVLKVRVSNDSYASCFLTGSFL